MGDSCPALAEPPRTLLTVREVRKIFQVSRSTVYRWIERGRLVKAGRVHAFEDYRKQKVVLLEPVDEDLREEIHRWIARRSPRRKTPLLLVQRLAHETIENLSLGEEEKRDDEVASLTRELHRLVSVLTEERESRDHMLAEIEQAARELKEGKEQAFAPILEALKTMREEPEESDSPETPEEIEASETPEEIEATETPEGIEATEALEEEEAGETIEDIQELEILEDPASEGIETNPVEGIEEEDLEPPEAPPTMLPEGAELEIEEELEIAGDPDPVETEEAEPDVVELGAEDLPDWLSDPDSESPAEDAAEALEENEGVEETEGIEEEEGIEVDLSEEEEKGGETPPPDLEMTAAELPEWLSDGEEEKPETEDEGGEEEQADAREAEDGPAGETEDEPVVETEDGPAGETEDGPGDPEAETQEEEVKDPPPDAEPADVSKPDSVLSNALPALSDLEHGLQEGLLGVRQSVSEVRDELRGLQEPAAQIAANAHVVAEQFSRLVSNSGETKDAVSRLGARLESLPGEGSAGSPLLTIGLGSLLVTWLVTALVRPPLGHPSSYLLFLANLFACVLLWFGRRKPRPGKS